MLIKKVKHVNNKLNNTSGLIFEIKEEKKPVKEIEENKNKINENILEDYAIFAGGCFWCIERDYEKIEKGIINVESGYEGSSEKTPNYQNHEGYREVVKVTYNKNEISYQDLVLYFITHIDPVDDGGQNFDRGYSYTTAIYYKNDQEKKTAEKIISEIENLKIIEGSIATKIEKLDNFTKAEEYHQDYYKKNPIRYNAYRKGSRRDANVKKYWSENDKNKLYDAIKEKVNIKESNVKEAEKLESLYQEIKKNNYEITANQKKDILKELTPLQIKVTQNNGTEQPFNNEYWNNKEKGIYLDIITGEPLFSSKQKYDSKTGWPSFTKPIKEENIKIKNDYKLIIPRKEVKTNKSDSHLGHVFKDGPKTLIESKGAEPTGLRYCLNSASLKFIPEKEMIDKGYSEYLKFL